MQAASMTRAKLAATVRRPALTLQRGVWGLVLIVALAGHFWLARLPFPIDAELAPPLAATPGERLVLVGPAAGVPLLEFVGAPGAAAEVRFERARLSLSSLSLLRSAGLDPPADDGPLEWLTTETGADGTRSLFTLGLPADAAGDARVELFQLQEENRRFPYFEVRTQGAELAVTLAAISADPFAERAERPAEQRTLIAGSRRLTLPAAVPLTIVVPAGEALRLRAVAAGNGAAQPPQWQWSMGTRHEGQLPLRAAGVRDSAGRFRQFACAAPARGPYARGADRLGEGVCDRGAATPTLVGEQLSVLPERLALTLRGLAWVARDGAAVNRGLLDRFAGEPRLMLALAAVDLALVLAAGLPLYRALRGRRAAPEPDIFISYRRDDSIAEAKDIADELARHLGADRIFIDLEDIRPGDRFLQRISENIARCRAMIVVIGPGWLGAMRDGQRRLDDPKDVVRHEIGEALRLGLLVIPVLVRDAPLPRPQDLPESLRRLLEHSALPVSVVRLREDVQRLAAALQPIESADGAETS